MENVKADRKFPKRESWYVKRYNEVMQDYMDYKGYSPLMRKMVLPFRDHDFNTDHFLDDVWEHYLK